MTQGDMSSIFISISLIVITAFIPSCSFPLRHVAGVKKVTQHHSKSRHLVLCWMTQVRTRKMICHCDLEADKLVADKTDKLKDGTRDDYRLEPSLVQQPACDCQQQQQQLEQHISALSSEVGLHVVHTFEHFHDHFLLCLVDIMDTENTSHRNISFQSVSEQRIHNLTEDLSQRNATSRKLKSEIMSRIHRLHSDLKGMDQLLFDRHREVVERRLQQHQEVVWFSSQYVHHHHSRSQAPELSHLEKRQHSGMQIDMPDTGQALSAADGVEPYSQSGYLHGLLLVNNSLQLPDSHIHDEDDNSSLRKFVRSFTFSRVGDLRRMTEYSLEQSHQWTQSNDSILHRNKSTPFSVPSASKRSVDKWFKDLVPLVSKQSVDKWFKDPVPSVSKQSVDKRFKDPVPSVSKQSVDKWFKDPVPSVSKQSVDKRFKDSVPSVSKQSLDKRFKDPVPSVSKQSVDKWFKDSVPSVSKQSLDKRFKDSIPSVSKQSLDKRFKDSVPSVSKQSLDKRFKDSVPSVSKQSVEMWFNDPKFPKQWHLVNKLTSGMDLNVTGVWMHNYTGSGVTIAVVDDGLEWRNPDLEANYNRQGSWDMNDNDPDPSPSASKLSNHHGTRCAGEIAAVANNSICGVGVAYQARISGLRVLDGLMTDSMEAEAFNMKMDINDIYSCSWGPDDDGRTVDGPHLMAAKALQHGVDFGRRGYGSIYVLASGNGGENLDNCNFDGYANSIYTVTVGAIDDKGNMPYYAEECASMLGVTFSSGTTNKRDIVTTDWTVGNTGGCTESHTGTSAAAPLAAAMIALMLEARPCLSWRDVQYIIILTAQMVNGHSAHSQRNGAGLLHSHKHGFGLFNSWRLVNAARIWQAVPWLTSYSYAESDLNLLIPKGKDVSLTVAHVVSDSDIRGLSLFTLENVQLTLTLSHPCRGQIGVTLTSPTGTVSVLAAPRPKDNSTDGFQDWTFTSVRCWGETPTGNWTFNITDHDVTLFGQGRVTKWRLTLFGTSLTSQEFANRQKLVESAMNGYFLNASPSPCPQSPRYDSVSAPISDRILKILILCGAFCFIMAMYETFEYMLCYNDEKQEAAGTRRLVDRAQELTHITRVLDSDGHQLSSMSNGRLEANPGQNLTDDEDEDTSETCRLLRDDRRGQGHSGVRGATEDIPLSTFSLQSLEDVGVRGATKDIPLSTFSLQSLEDVGVRGATKDIPLSTFSLQSLEDVGVRGATKDISLSTFSLQSLEQGASHYFPLLLASRQDIATREDKFTLNGKPDHIAENPAPSVMSNSIHR